MTKLFTSSIVALFVISVMSSCTKDEEISFNIVHESTVEIPGATVENIYFEERTSLFESSLDTNLSINKSSRELITKIYPKSVSISNNSGFGYLKEVQVFIGKANGDTVAISKNDTLSEEQQFMTTVELPLISDEQDLMSYAKEDLLYYSLRMKINSFSPNERSFSVSSTLGVIASKE